MIGFSPRGLLKVGIACFAIIVTFLNAAHADLEMDDFDEASALISPTRIKQSPHDVPASVTKICRDTIEDLQLNSIPEVFKYVAGMISSYASGNQPRINYHGTNGMIPRRMQVLLDGVSVYRASFAEVIWPTLPITIRDIECIEFTRSPSAAAYGANSMMAVVNITTREPLQVSTVEASATIGSFGTRNYDVLSALDLNDAGRIRFSLGKTENTGFDTNFEGDNRHDSSDSLLFNSRGVFTFGSSTALSVFVGYSDVFTELEFRESGQRSFPDVDTKSLYVTGDLSHSFNSRNELTIRSSYTRVTQDMEWDTCGPLALFSYNLRALDAQNPDYAATLVGLGFPTGGTEQDDALRNAFLLEVAELGDQALEPWCGKTNEDSQDGSYRAEVQFNSLISESFRYVGGAGFNRNWIESETYLGGGGASNQYYLFGNAEFRVGKWLFNAGAMLEDEPLYLDALSFSPRVGVNYRLLPSTTLRLVLSKALRTPDILEYDRNWSYKIYDTTTPHPEDGSRERLYYLNSRAEGNIESEEILARELSVYHRSSAPLAVGMFTRSFDVKYFYNSLTSLVSEKLQFFDYNPTNDGEVTLQGIEVEADLTFSNVLRTDAIDKIRLHLNYAYIDNQTDEFYERTLHAQHSGAMYAIVDYQYGWLTSLSYFGNSEIQGDKYSAFELGVGKTSRFGDNRFTVKGKVVYTPERKHSFTSSETFAVQNINDQRTSFYVTMEYAFE